MTLLLVLALWAVWSLPIGILIGRCIAHGGDR